MPEMRPVQQGEREAKDEGAGRGLPCGRVPGSRGGSEQGAAIRPPSKPTPL